MIKSLTFYPLYLVGSTVLKYIKIVGGLSLFFYKIISTLFKTDYDQTFKTLNKTLLSSLPLMLVTGVLVGIIMVIQTGFYVKEFQMSGVLGWGVGYVSFRDITPLMVALMFSGQIGANSSSQLAHMRATNQIDSLSIVGVDPIPYLVTPKFISIILIMVTTTVFADFTTIIAGIVGGIIFLNIEPTTFLDSFFSYIKFSDLYFGIIKAFFFSMAIGLTTLYNGFYSGYTASETGKAVQKGVVWSAVTIFFTDYILTTIFEFVWG